MKKLLSVVMLSMMITVSSVSAFASTGVPEKSTNRSTTISQNSAAKENEKNSSVFFRQSKDLFENEQMRAESRSHSLSPDKNKGLVYEKTFTVSPKGATVQVGFVTISFPNNFLPASELPRTFTAKVFASDGHGVIEFTPDTTGFLKPVEVTVNVYSGVLYDEKINKNTYVRYYQESFQVNHFSRYCWQ